MKCANCIYFNPARANPFSVGLCAMYELPVEFAWRDETLCNEGAQKVELTPIKTTGAIEA